VHCYGADRDSHADNSALRLTTSRFHTPNGQSIEGRGVQPDVNVENSTNKDTDAQLQKAIEAVEVAGGPNTLAMTSDHTRRRGGVAESSRPACLHDHVALRHVRTN